MFASGVGPTNADVTAVSASAFGESVNVSLFGGAPTTSGPLPSVALPASGGAVDDDAPSVAVGEANTLAPFGGTFLETGTLRVNSQGSTGSSGSSTSSASIAAVDALGGTLIAAELASTCTSTETAAKGSSSIGGGSLMVSGTETMTLADNPAPNTTIEGTNEASGDTFTVILNEQIVRGTSITVNGIRIVLNGPSALGEVILAQSHCDLTATAAPASTTTSTSPPAPPVTDGEESGSPTADATTLPAGSEGFTAHAAAPSGSAIPDDDATVSAAVVPGASVLFAAADVSKVSGGAYGYYVNVGLFGGPATARGPAPSVDLPESGSATPITASEPDGGRAQYGPAVIFGGIWPESAGQAPASGPISVSTQGTTGANGSVTSSVDIVKFSPPRTNQPGGIGPGPLIADEAHSTCTANQGGVTGSARFVNGTLETKYDKNTQLAIEDEPIPVNPPVNYTREGTIDHVGDSFRIVFNEQTTKDGVLTVNAAHMYLLGPIAKGEMIVGQTRCGVTVAAAATSSSTPGSAAAPGSAAGTGSSSGSGSTSGPGSLSASGTSAESPAGVASGSGSRAPGAVRARSGSQAGSTSSSTGAPLANTGAEAPLVPVLALVLAALCARRSAQRRPPTA